MFLAVVAMWQGVVLLGRGIPWFMVCLGWCAGRLGWYLCGGLTGHPAWLVLWIVFDLDTPISLLLVICLLVLLFAVSVVGCLLGYSSCLVVWIPLFLDPSDGAFGRFDLAALCGCRTLNFCLFLFMGLGFGFSGMIWSKCNF